MLRKASSLRPSRQPSYRLHKARSCAVVTINGKNHCHGTYGSPESHQKYASLISQWRANGQVTPSSVANQVNGNLSISELILGYMNHAEGYYKDYGTKHQGEISNLSHAMKPLQNLYGHTPDAAILFTPFSTRWTTRRLPMSSMWTAVVSSRVFSSDIVFQGLPASWATSDNIAM